MPSSSSSDITSKLPSVGKVEDDLKEASKGAASSFRSLAAGAVGGFCAVIVGHPFDLVKVRMQTAEKGVYSGALDCFRRGVAKDGLRRVRLHGFLSSEEEFNQTKNKEVLQC